MIAEDDKNISNIISESIKEFEKDIDIVVFEEAQKALLEIYTGQRKDVTVKPPKITEDKTDEQEQSKKGSKELSNNHKTQKKTAYLPV